MCVFLIILRQLQEQQWNAMCLHSLGGVTSPPVSEAVQGAAKKYPLKFSAIFLAVARNLEVILSI